MTFDDAIKALSLDALKNVKDEHVIGLGSGRAATAFCLLYTSPSPRDQRGSRMPGCA